jgi:hypothetical protein
VGLQAQDRAHRIGQRKQVVVYRLICSDTVEERILELSERKLALDHVLMAGRDDDGAGQSCDIASSIFSMSEMWSILRHGAERVLRASGDESSCVTEQLDRIIEKALAPDTHKDAAPPGGRSLAADAGGLAGAGAGGAMGVARGYCEGVAGTIFELEVSMDNEADRLATFKPGVWPHGAWIAPERLAAAGLFASPTPVAPGRVVCFACHNALTEWEPNDDPWEKHCKRYPDCPFVQQAAPEWDKASALDGPALSGANQAGPILLPELRSIARSKGLPCVSVLFSLSNSTSLFFVVLIICIQFTASIFFNETVSLCSLDCVRNCCSESSVMISTIMFKSTERGSLNWMARLWPRLVLYEDSLAHQDCSFQCLWCATCRIRENIK